MRQIPLFPRERKGRASNARPFIDANLRAARVIADNPELYPGLPLEWARVVLNRIEISRHSQATQPFCKYAVGICNRPPAFKCSAGPNLKTAIRQGFAPNQ